MNTKQTYCRSCGVLQTKDNSSINSRVKTKVSFVRNCNKCEARRVLKINISSLSMDELIQRIDRYNNILDILNEEVSKRRKS